jgi:hypothetical protein
MSDYDPNNPLEGASECPHCGGVAKAVPHDEYRYVCNLCGAPRIEAAVEGIELSGDEHDNLNNARDAIRQRNWWRFGGVLGGLAGSFGLLVTLIFQLLFSPESALWSATGVVMSLPFILLAFVALARSKSKTEEIDREIDEAWRTAARDVVMQSESITAQQLTEILPMNQADAEQVAAELSVDDLLHSRITDDGKLRLEPVASVRIDAGATPGGKTIVSDDSLEQRFEALEEAMATEAADAEQQADKEMADKEMKA